MNAPQPLRKSASFAGVSYAEAITRARSLVPALRERAHAAEAARTMSEETIADLHASGVIRSMQPRRRGGMEFDYVAYVDFPLELSRGDASVGWNLANLQIHHWMLALYDERAQEEVWGENPDALIASGIAFPQGQGRRTDGGFVISGKWNFSSCSNIADWNMLAVTVKDGDKAVDHRMCLLKKSQYQVIDDWKVLGMRSTGSMTVAAKDVFVPE
ncbi:MAG TPA: acyl-CoA dehydrogenase family protein, partial [Burkholderiales bacterium]|nr:acyl-CoA dehydrogenase family protein [Burkholderiales bacterium]